MAHRLLFTFVLVTVLSSVISFSSIDYAYSKESKSSQDGEVEMQGQSSDNNSKSQKDSDKNKIVDALDEEIKNKSDSYKKDVIALLNLPSDQAGGKVKLLKKFLGEFEIDDVYSVIPGFSATMTKKQILALAALSDTLQIEPDLEVHAFLDESTVWFGVQQARTDLGVDGNADGNPTVYSKDDIVIAVVDTGINPNHLDLDSGKIIACRDFVNGGTVCMDDNGHGTHVASIAAGEGQANPAYAGVAPRAALVGVKVLNSAGSGSTSTVISGVNWVVQNKALYGIEIMNLSLGSTGCSNGSDSLSLAINSAVNNGIVVTVAAGNSGPKTCTIGSPGAAQNAITVGAMADVGELGFSIAYFSSRGPTADNRIKPDIVAAGVSITAAQSGTTTGYTTLSGTSMATPFVAGVAALMLDANPSLTPADVKARIMNTAIDWGPAGIDVDYGAGRLDAYEAVNNALSVASLGNIAVPTHTFISDSLGATGSTDTWSIDVADTSYPISIAMIMTSWSSSSSPDFDIELYSPSSTLIAISDGTTRQETIKASVSTTGIYTLEVYSYTGSGPYFVDLSSGSAPPPPPNNAPVAVDDSATTEEDVSVIVNVLAGDSDPDFDTLTVTSVSAPSKGVATNNGDGTVTYNPNLNSNGADSFTYTISDGKGGTDTGSVSITVNAINDAPVSNNQSVTTTKDTPVAITLAGSDVDGGAPIYSVVVGPTNGVLSGIAPSLTYTPNTNFVGLDSFTFKANDGSLDSNIAMVDITVNPPVEQIFSDDFPNFAKWTESNEFDWNVEKFAEKNVPGHTASNLVAHADRCTSSTGCILTSNAVDLSGYQSATLTFWRYVDNDLDNNEFLRVQIFDGTNWNTIFSWTNRSGDDDTWHQETFNLSGYLNSGFNLRFVSKQSSSSEDTEIDDVLISGVPKI
ncbi:MAG: serine protease AprX [Candidatus Nitrosomirales archaeon]|jgi:serine protease AprX